MNANVNPPPQLQTVGWSCSHSLALAAHPDPDQNLNPAACPCSRPRVMSLFLAPTLTMALPVLEANLFIVINFRGIYGTFSDEPSAKVKYAVEDPINCPS